MKKMKKFLSCLMTAAVALSALSAAGCDEKDKEGAKEADAPADVLETTQAAEPVTAPAKEDLPKIDECSAEPSGMLGRAKSLMSVNDEAIGYIRIPHTSVDYPVFQYRGSDKEDLEKNGNAYYMDTDMYGDYLESGSIFMDYRDVFVPGRKNQSNNLVLYGHNMLNGSKFATLHYYRHDNEFYKESPIIEFSSNYEDTKYAVIACFATSGEYGESSYGEEFAYWDMENMDEKEFEKYMKIVKDRSTISPDVDVKYGDQLLTLQTCFMDEDNSRYLVIGRRLRDGEKVSDFTYDSSNDNDDKDKDEDKEEDSADEE